MTILSELAALYHRRADRAGWPRPGFSTEPIGAEVVLREDGTVEFIRPLIAPDEKGRMRPQRLSVPSVSRTSGIMPALLWDKSAYALGVTAALGENGKPLKDDDGNSVPGQGRRTAAEHAAFREANSMLLEGATAPALVAFRRFLDDWRPEHFGAAGHPPMVIDQNLVFRLGDGPRLHEVPEVISLLQRNRSGEAPCLVTGRPGPMARLHPLIRGVIGAQSSGASLVSFNNDAEASHGKKQGENAPVSEAAAFAYGTALNALLAKGSGKSLRIGDATVAFWAHGAGEAEAEGTLFDALHGPGGLHEDDKGAERRLRDHLVEIAIGRVPPESGLDPETRVFILGLAPNAARLSVRFWQPGTLGEIARDITRFWAECRIAPSPFIGKDGVDRPPRPWALLYEVAAQGKAENIPPLLGGALMRAVLTGGPYPQTLLSGVIGRLRADRENTEWPREQARSDGRRAAIIRAVLTRAGRNDTEGEVVPMALNEEAKDIAYLLGRLFGAYVYAEKSNQARGAGLRDKYMGAASATPARIFPMLMRGYEHNLSSLRKAGGQKAGAGVRADKAVAAIMSGLPDDGMLPVALALEDQGRFFVGFYHQTSAFYGRPEDAAEALTETGDGEIAE